jgi:hypothetical protein
VHPNREHHPPGTKTTENGGRAEESGAGTGERKEEERD